MITNDDDSHYRQEVDRFVDYKSIMVKGEAVDQMDSYRYIGLVRDNKLVWCFTDEIIKKVHSRPVCLRKLRSFRVREDILQVFFLSTVSSVLTYWAIQAGLLTPLTFGPHRLLATSCAKDYKAHSL